MDYSVRHISGSQYQIDLLPSTPEEHKILQTTKPENLDMYYHKAVETKLGASASLLSIENRKLDRYSVIGIVEFAKGIGGL